MSNIKSYEDFNFNEIVKRLLQGTGLKTQKKLAKALGISEQSLTNRKNTGGLLQSLVSYAGSKNINIDWLLFGEGDVYTRFTGESPDPHEKGNLISEKQPPWYSADSDLTDEERQVATAFREISPDRRRGVFINAIDELNDSLKDEEIRRDQRKRQLILNAIKILSNIVGEL